MLSGVAKRKKKKREEEQKGKQRGALKKFLSGCSVSRPTAADLLESAEPEAGPEETQPKDEVEDAAGNATEDAVAPTPSTSTQSQTELEGQQPARSEPNIQQEPPDPERVLRSYPSDPAKWCEIDERMREYFALNHPSQNIGDISASQRKYRDINRCLTKEHFFRKKLNGETLSRKWLVYSPSTGTVFGFCCKLFSVRDNHVVTGYNKNCANRLHEHENSMDHRTAVLSLSSLGNKNARIDSTIVKQQESERAYWLNILKRIVATIQFLSSRGLPFRGDDELIGSPHNGNFLGCLELISRFDPLLSEQMCLARYGNKGRGHNSYLSSTVCDEFIQLMAEKVPRAIVKEVKDGKYFSIIVDSTPDITHVDQLTLMIRYVLKKSREPVERFLEFIPLHGHTAEHMEETLKFELKELDIDLMDCRGQSYDNASNMAGKYSGLQARVKNKNPNADFIPCSAHSLNLVGACAAECCIGAVSFFGFIQNHYNFFSASSRRWEILTAHLTATSHVALERQRQCSGGYSQSGRLGPSGYKQKSAYSTRSSFQPPYTGARHGGRQRPSHSASMRSNNDASGASFTFPTSTTSRMKRSTTKREHANSLRSLQSDGFGLGAMCYEWLKHAYQKWPCCGPQDAENGNKDGQKSHGAELLSKTYVP
nr:uncharacterized protein LOC129161607 [Nothobranchius furzeri]